MYAIIVTKGQDATVLPAKRWIGVKDHELEDEADTISRIGHLFADHAVALCGNYRIDVRGDFKVAASIWLGGKLGQR